MGSIEAYESAAGRRYRVRYRKPDHSQANKRGFRTKREAELYLASVEIKKARGDYIDAAEARATVGDLGEQWMSSQTHLKPSSVAVIESAWRLHVRPAWGTRSIGEIRHSDVQQWVSHLSAGGERIGKPKSPALVHRCYGILAGILDVAVRDHRLASNPARGVSLPRKVSKEHRYLTHEQLHKLAEASGENATLILLLGYTGLRWGEASALRVKDIDLEKRRLHIVENAVFVRGEVIVGSPKTHKRRSVPFPAFLAERLRAATTGKTETELVFPGRFGEHQRTPTIRENSWFDKALVRAELSPMTIHDLRHTTASLAVSAGANVKAVQRMLGHASAAMTLDVYADLFNDDLDDVAQRLDEAASMALDHTSALSRKTAPEHHEKQSR
ncbi:tyrosine-type recombinase/integrase [Leifsonia sp. EB34]|uniref:tyrosine-type recombinase/integrase n=1 Tax=Leifsonia sp. EB34 TaxID=3156303 RepID=UPI00351741EF